MIQHVQVDLVYFTTRVPDPTETSLTRVQHEYNMSATLVKHECDMSEKNFDNKTRKNIFSHPYIYYVASERS